MYFPFFAIRYVLYYNFYRSYKTDIQLQDEVANLLIKFKSLDIKQFVITNGVKEVQEYKIKKLELDKLIDDYVVGEGEHRKPNPYHFIEFLEKYKLNSFETVSVGDLHRLISFSALTRKDFVSYYRVILKS